MPTTVYSINFTVVNDTTLLMPIPQTSGERQLHVRVTVDGALSSIPSSRWIDMAPVPFIRSLTGCTNGTTSIDCHPEQMLSMRTVNFAGRNDASYSLALIGGTAQSYSCGSVFSPELWVVNCALPTDVAAADRHRPLQMQVTNTNTGWVSNSVTVTITDDLRIDSVSGCTSEPSSGTAGCLPGATLTVLGAGFTMPASLGLYAAADINSTQFNASYLANITATVVNSGRLVTMLPLDVPLARWLSVQLTCGVLSPVLAHAVVIVSPFSSTGGSTGSANGDDLPLGLSLAELIAAHGSVAGVDGNCVCGAKMFEG